ncbi:hypothetical protein [Pontibacillus chungwhensis]|uniref:hypothetical protein n=1 Tax=Pontibacillus chungwhensis TaxID=265426 RepID=UPI000AB37051|nr:hypothetical protein [Pontibacillus chungwhensis]
MKQSLMWLMAMIISMFILIWAGFNHHESLVQILLAINFILYLGLKRSQQKESS